MRNSLFSKDQNPAHGSGRMVQVLSTNRSLNHVLIPPTVVGGYFKSSLFIMDPGHRSSLGLMNSADLKYPPTAVGGIGKLFEGG